MPRRSFSLHDSVSYWLNRLLSGIRDRLDDAFDEHHVTVAQWTVLVSLYNDEAETPAELADFIGIDRAAVTRLLDRLEAKGFLRRKQRGSDRRSITVKLTAAGLELTPKLARVSKQANRKLTKGISPAEAHSFHRIVQKMLANVS